MQVRTEPDYALDIVHSHEYQEGHVAYKDGSFQYSKCTVHP